MEKEVSSSRKSARSVVMAISSQLGVLGMANQTAAIYKYGKPTNSVA